MGKRETVEQPATEQRKVQIMTRGEIRDEQREELLRLAEENGGALSPTLLVDSARSETSPFHDRFVWDDTIAGERYRRIQAGVILRQVKVTFLAQSHGPARTIDVKEVRALQSPAPDRGKGAASYQSVSTIMSDAEKRAAMVATVKAELASIRKRYSELTELSSVWEAIDQV